MVYGKKLLWITLIFIILAVWFTLWLLAEAVFAEDPCSDNQPPAFSSESQTIERDIGSGAGVDYLYWIGRFSATDPDGDTLVVGPAIIWCGKHGIQLDMEVIASDGCGQDTLNLTIVITCNDNENETMTQEPPDPVIDPPDPVIDPPDPVVDSPDPVIDPPITDADEIVEIVEQVSETTEETEIEVPEPPPPPEPVYERVNWNFQFYRYWNLVTMPVIPEGVVTIADLYDHWTFFRALNAQIIFLVDGRWVLYTGDRAQQAGEIPLRRHMGLVVRLDSPSFLGVVRGTRLYNAETLILQPGLNLLGFHGLPIGIERPSDLLRSPLHAVVVTKEGESMLVARLDDSGDEPLGMGQAMLVFTAGPAVIDTMTGKITDYTPAAGAPQATR